MTFKELGLGDALLAALDAVGYESPSPIQAATIPPLLEGKDLVGQAQTGTGKTAAFALPILQRVRLEERRPQALVITPTRELAVQVAEAFKKYASKLPGFHVMPIYGGQSYSLQLSALRRGVHVVVGTPGRLIDHIERGVLDLSRLTTLVLDEADEMLRMGFIDDVETILKRTPESRQTALFSATMPPPIRRIAQTYLRDPVEITIKSKTSTATNIRQRYWLVSGAHKLDALTRILEAETIEGVLIFTRTKAATEDLAGRLSARGFEASPLNGDMDQRARERVVARLKAGDLDIVIATDVAARGLDVERVSHVVNFDIPTDAESYIHRIGRTGRAGRSGEAILFVSPRERHLLRAIERATRQPVTPMELPTVADVNDARVQRFRDRIDEALTAPDLGVFREQIESYERERNVPAIEIAAALARVAHGDAPFFLQAQDYKRAELPPDGPRREPRQRQEDPPMDTFRLEIGAAHGVTASNIVGAVANELRVRSEFIGKIRINEDHSFIDLPTGMPERVFTKLGQIRVNGRELRASILGGPSPAPAKAPRPPQGKGPPRPQRRKGK
ncbi:MAG: DEAD/DEAH box helicase [Myxococcota bacterium]